MSGSVAVLVTVSGVRALGEIVHDMVTGLLFPPLDAEALADALQLLLGNQELRRELGANAKQWVARDRTGHAARGRAGRPLPVGNRP